MAKPATPGKPVKKPKDQPVPEMVRRQEATAATLAKYRGKAFDWGSGVTCVHMAKFQMRQMGHHGRTVPRIRSELAARKALKERGWKDVCEMLDSVLPRIPPAMMLLGDLAVAGSADGMGAIMVCAGPQKLLGWREDAEALVVLDVKLDELDGAWRA